MILFSDIWTHLKLGSYYPCLCVWRTITTSYLYRGVISDRQIIGHYNGQVTFTYRNSETGKTEQRTLKGEDFLWLALHHVLPKSFRRTREHGFLHCKAKRWLNLVQLILQVLLKPLEPVCSAKASLPNLWL